MALPQSSAMDGSLMEEWIHLDSGQSTIFYDYDLVYVYP